MFNIGGTELFVILIIAFAVVGPKDLPKIARALARLVKKTKLIITELKKETGFDEVEQELKGVRSDVLSVGREVSGTLKEADIRADLKKEMDTIKAETRDAVNLAEDAVKPDKFSVSGKAQTTGTLPEAETKLEKKKPLLGYKEFAAQRRNTQAGQKTAPQPADPGTRPEKKPETEPESEEGAAHTLNTDQSNT